MPSATKLKMNIYIDIFVQQDGIGKSCLYRDALVQISNDTKILKEITFNRETLFENGLTNWEAFIDEIDRCNEKAFGQVEEKSFVYLYVYTQDELAEKFEQGLVFSE